MVYFSDERRNPVNLLYDLLICVVYSKEIHKKASFGSSLK